PTARDGPCGGARRHSGQAQIPQNGRCPKASEPPLRRANSSRVCALGASCVSYTKDAGNLHPFSIVGALESAEDSGENGFVGAERGKTKAIEQRKGSGQDRILIRRVQGNGNFATVASSGGARRIR